MNSKLMEIDASFEDNRICNYSTKGNAYTMFMNDKPVFAIAAGAPEVALAGLHANQDGFAPGNDRFGHLKCAPLY